MTLTVDCPWCSGPVFLRDEDEVIACEACDIRADLVPDERALLADAA